jgi:glycoside/pentoside/hexuronide:cation symporter, GPH family
VNAIHGYGWLAQWQIEAVDERQIVILHGYRASTGRFWAMMPDTVEYGEWRSGVRSKGAIFGLVSLIQKAGLGLAAAALGELLARAGYRANVAQSRETLVALKQIMVLAPALLACAVGAVIAFYPLDARKHDRPVLALTRRRNRRQRSDDTL